MSFVIEARNLVKSYAGKKAVNGLHLQVKKGECFGLLGANDAGKSTALRMMYCSSPPSSGELFVLGLNVLNNARKIKSSIGVVPQESGLDPDFSVLENLLVYARYFGIPKRTAITRAREILRFMHLEEYDEQTVETLQLGLQRRLAIARALLSEPDLVLIDEPTTGLDLQARLLIWEALSAMKQQHGVSLVIATHHIEEAEKVCDRVAILDKGRVLAEGTPRDLIREHIGHEVVEFDVSSHDLDYYVKKVKGKFPYQILNQRIRLFVGGQNEGRQAFDLISSNNISIRKASLHDVFLKLAGYELRI